jgi:hypothetical protein
MATKKAAAPEAKAGAQPKKAAMSAPPVAPHAKKAAGGRSAAATAKKPGAVTAGPAPAPAAKKASAATGPYAEEPKFLEEQRGLLITERTVHVGQALDLRAEADSLALEREPGDVQFDEESGEGGTVAVDRERDLALSAQAAAAVEEMTATIQGLRATAGDLASTAKSNLRLTQAVPEKLETIAQEMDISVGTVLAMTDTVQDLQNLLAEWRLPVATRAVDSYTDAMRSLLSDWSLRINQLLEEKLTLQDLTFRYELVQPPALADLFDLGPVTVFDPPKYTCGWDRRVDKTLNAWMEEATQGAQRNHPGVLRITLVDVNGFVIAEPRAFAGNLVGDPAQDHKNLVKQWLFDSPGLMSLLRHAGLADARLDQRQLLAEEVADCMLPRDSQPFDVLTYRRVTGDLMLDVAVPIYACGLYVGALIGGGPASALI